MSGSAAPAILKPFFPGVGLEARLQVHNKETAGGVNADFALLHDAAGVSSIFGQYVRCFTYNNTNRIIIAVGLRPKERKYLVES